MKIILKIVKCFNVKDIHAIFTNVVPIRIAFRHITHICFANTIFIECWKNSVFDEVVELLELFS